MVDVFGHAVAEILDVEKGFVNDPRDPGGATNWGITIAVLRAWRNAPVTVADVQNLTPDEAKNIYKALYWDKVHGDDLPPAAALVIFDCAVNQGVGTAIHLAQRAMSIIEDGVIGPQTLKTLQTADPMTFISYFMAARTLNYASQSGWSTYNKGWMRRLFKMTLETSNFLGG